MIRENFKNNELQGQEKYLAPCVNVVNLTTANVICQSGGINDMIVDPDGGNSFTPNSLLLI